LFVPRQHQLDSRKTSLLPLCETGTGFLPRKIIILGGSDFCKITQKLLIHFRGGHPNRVQRWFCLVLAGRLPLSRQIRQFNKALFPSLECAWRRQQLRLSRVICVGVGLCIHAFFDPEVVVPAGRSVVKQPPRSVDWGKETRSLVSVRPEWLGRATKQLQWQ
jgi:hypothetical protein